MPLPTKRSAPQAKVEWSGPILKLYTPSDSIELAISMPLNSSAKKIAFPWNLEVLTAMKNQRPIFLFSLLSAALLLHLQPISTVGYSDSDSDSNNNNNTNTEPSANATSFIRTSCGATLYPELCYTSLSGYANGVQQDPAQLARVAIAVSLSKAQHMANYVSNLTRQADYGDEPRAAAALHDCFTVFGDAVDQIRGSLKQMRRLNPGESFKFQMSNVQTWMSAALTNEDTCKDGFEDVSDEPIKTDVCDRVVKVTEVTSNALALVNSYVSKVTTP
ncbi:hypothetical protein F0562_033486 [Nyssa sinensis]|uniref:Pectinesterase inhibitor domain-containing protein n=1 Tax=Nyssa sinensis TaxID=561372 RepID=A0A5J5AH03_9ASTE|nr:hypothetical protein F0562_033486 [Nyssa sinensis]